MILEAVSGNFKQGFEGGVLNGSLVQLVGTRIVDNK